MAEMLQEIQEKDEKLMCFQEQEERLQQLEKELSELLQILPDTEMCIRDSFKGTQKGTQHYSFL